MLVLYPKPATSPLHATVGGINLCGLSIDAPQLLRLAVGQVVHGIQGNVEAGTGVVDGQDVDGLAGVVELPAGAAAGRVPAGDGLGTANVGEFGDVALLVPALSRDETVGAVGAGDDGERAVAVVVARVEGDCWV